MAFKRYYAGYYTGPLGFRPLFVYGEVPFCARVWQAPHDEPCAMRSLIVNDLDGNLICFASNLPG